MDLKIILVIIECYVWLESEKLRPWLAPAPVYSLSTKTELKLHQTPPVARRPSHCIVHCAMINELMSTIATIFDHCASMTNSYHFFRKMYPFKYVTWTWRKKTTFELKLYLKTLLLFPSKVQSLILIPEYKNEDAKSSLFTENELNFVPEHVNKKILKVISISDIHHNIIGWYKKEYWISQIPRIWGVASAEWKEPVAGRSSSQFQTPELALQMLGLSWQAFLSSKQGMAHMA